MIQTVTGAISKTKEGAVLMHEHISCSSLSFSKAFGKKWLNTKELSSLSIKTLKGLKKTYGVEIFVDGTPIDIGRNPLLLKKVSKLSGVKIVASTGFYCLQSIETINNSANDIANWIVNECKNGIEGSNIKPGILKCATGKEGITVDNSKKLAAIGIAQNKTGLPVYVHCEHKENIAHKQIEILVENGANIQKIIIGHTAMRPEPDYLESILKTGCYICMDQCHCYPQNINTIAETLVNLCQMGYEDKILLSNDYCIHSDFCNKDKNGLHIREQQHIKNLAYVLVELYDKFIEVGGTQEEWNCMIYKNPICVLDV